MEFTAYAKMRHLISHWAPESAPFVVQEKIHGANMQAIATWADGCVDVRFASRRKILSSDASFFGFQPLAARLRRPVEQAANSLRVTLAAAGLDVIQVSAYGELYGGIWPK